MITDCGVMRERLKAMHQQKAFLSDQLKAIMKRNKVLQMELELYRGDGSQQLSSLPYNPTNSGELLVVDSPLMIDENDANDDADCGFNFEHAYENEDELLVDEEVDMFVKTAPVNLAIRTRSRSTASSLSRSPPYSRSNSPKLGGVQKSHTMPLLHNFEALDAQLTRPLSPAERRLQIASEDCLLDGLVATGKVTTTNFLPPLLASSPIQKQKKKSQSLFTRQVSMPHLDFSPKKSHKDLFLDIKKSRNDIEVHLENSVRMVFKEVQERKKNAEQLCSSRILTTAATTATIVSNSTKLKRHKLTLSSSRKDLTAEHRVVPASQVRQLGSLSGLGLQQLQDNDRFAAMVKFLSEPSVFQFVSSLGF
jgi:hypothetical protein